MNKRIRQLAEQAGFLNKDEESIEYFAELIVQECIAQCEKNKDHEWLGAGSKLSAFNIKEHFGVEE